MDLRDEVSGTEGTIWLNHWLRTGFEMFSSGGGQGYVAEKAELEQGWLFPVGNEEDSLGYVEMFNDMFDSIDNNTKPTEDFYDGYVVNCILDTLYKSAQSGKWEPVEIEVIKEERMPDGKIKLILQHKETGKVNQIFK